MQKEHNKDKCQRIFFKQFIKNTSQISPSSHSKSSNEHKLNKLERSNIAIKKMIKEIENSRKEKEKQGQSGNNFRQSFTHEEKRSKIEKEPIIHNEFNVLKRTLGKKSPEFMRSKTVEECTQQNGTDHKYARIADLNKKFKERREHSLKLMFNNSFCIKAKDQDKVNRISANIKSMTQEIAKTSTMPLQTKHKSSINIEPKTQTKAPFEVSQSSSGFQSNLLNPEPADRLLLRQEGSDSAKRFYLKLKKNKVGTLFTKPSEKELSLLESQAVTKQIPSELGIYKILLPKRNHRHQFLQNIQKIKQSYLRIKGHGHTLKEADFQQVVERKKQREVAGQKKVMKKTYEIKYRKMISPRKQDKIIRSKTQFFHNRTQWQAFVSAPFQPWETNQTAKLYT